MKRKYLILLVIPLLFFELILVFPFKMTLSFAFLGYIDNSIYQVFNKDKITATQAYTQRECIKIGGKWQKLGLLQREGCQIYSTDSNKSCFSGFQCQLGTCETSVNSSLFTLGKCSGTSSRFGCSKEVNFGIAANGMCID